MPFSSQTAAKSSGLLGEQRHERVPDTFQRAHQHLAQRRPSHFSIRARPAAGASASFWNPRRFWNPPFPQTRRRRPPAAAPAAASSPTARPAKAAARRSRRRAPRLQNRAVRRRRDRRRQLLAKHKGVFAQSAPRDDGGGGERGRARVDVRALVADGFQQVPPCLRAIEIASPRARFSARHQQRGRVAGDGRERLPPWPRRRAPRSYAGGRR